MGTTDERIASLEAHVAELSALVERLTTERRTEPASSPTEARASSRRNVLKLAGAAAVGAVALATGSSTQAAAASGDALLLGEENDPQGDRTTIDGQFVAINSGTPSEVMTGLSGVLIGWDTKADLTHPRGGVVGIGGGGSFGNGGSSSGVIGLVADLNGVGDGVVARSASSFPRGRSAGLRASSSEGPAIQLEASSGRWMEGTWTEGAFRPDAQGNLWYCVASGLPGTWRKLAGPDTAGSLHCVAPGRAYDSRAASVPDSGPIASGTNRTVSVANRRNTSDGEVIEIEFVPTTATAVSVNVTVTETVGSGYLAMNPGGLPNVRASAINWTASNQTVANCLPIALNNARELTIICAGGGSTHFVIDVLGYYL
ncbi:MAG: hypothetical protein JWN99_1397 [Ilumatobacteraceae bacterium]|nr:hypothetical protein [Ilumatobacteraceae bacterium]